MTLFLRLSSTGTWDISIISAEARAHVVVAAVAAYLKRPVIIVQHNTTAVVSTGPLERILSSGLGDFLFLGRVGNTHFF